MPRRAIHRKDTYQTPIVEALRQAGYTVAVTSQLGDGYPDLHVAKDKRSGLIELKTPPSKKWTGSKFSGRFTLLSEDEQLFHARWPCYIPIVFDVDEALAAAKKMCG